jgi:nucleoside-diphosphate-sugar epimerase
MKIFVTGGSGFVGRVFIRYVLSSSSHFDYRLVCLSRSTQSDDIIIAATDGLDSSRVQTVRGDLSNIDYLTDILRGCDVVIHIAAKVEIWGVWEDFLAANVIGTKNLLEAARTNSVRRFIHISSEAAVATGFQNGCLENVDEISSKLALELPFYAPYTTSKALAEKAVIEANDIDFGFETIILRPRLVWGAEDTKLLPSFIKAIKTGQLKWFTPEIRTSTCHIENLCEGILLAIVNGKGGEVYFLTDGIDQVLQFNEFLKEMLKNIPGINQVGTMDSKWAWFYACTVENIPFAGYGIYREPPISRQILLLLAQNVILNDNKARQELGYTSHKIMEEGFVELWEYVDELLEEEEQQSGK